MSPLAGQPSARYRISLAGRTHEVAIDAAGRVTIDGHPRAATLVPTGAPDGFALTLDTATLPLRAHRRAPGRWEIALGGRAIAAEVLDERQARIRALSGGQGGEDRVKPLLAPMPGLVVQVAVQEGDDVAAGDTVLIVEAMKMENELRAAAAARVTRVRVAPGEAVEKGQLLIEFEAVNPA